MKNLIVLLAIITLFSCKEDCEKENTGSITIQNKTSDLIQGSIGGEINFLLQPLEEFSRELPAGSYSIFAEASDGTWWSVTENIESCEENTQELIK